MTSQRALLEELKKKHAGHDTRNLYYVWDFLAAFGSPVDAIMYLDLFWPNFVSFEGMVFREETLEDDEDRQRVRDALHRYGGNRTMTEEAFNLVEVPSDVFSNVGESSDETDEYIAGKLVELWSHGLAAAFPDDEFVVKRLSANETGGETGVIFHMLRNDR